ncbi:putative bifunctional diguanylate cyclase/phosphodiesterase [Methylophilus flavus]|jgi:diguanylate cyclase (GGDEF)-like protein|uniref:Bifunctional diguanylate cyclase/phosphodiesterase n=1 Tax=Methylophilus flavus TaxID=640084 RepID=A0ABW3PJQ8_9PROT
MPFSKTTSPELLLARYRSLMADVPVVIFAGLSATAIQVIALRDGIDWRVSVAMPLVRMTLAAMLFLYWFWHREDNPGIEKVRWRLRAASIVLVISGVVTFFRSLYLFQHTDNFGHYFLVIYITLFALCFAFILSKIGIAAFIYNFLLISAALVCIFMGNFEQPYVLAGLVLVFEIGMLFAMRASANMFDRLVNATYETHSLMEENQRLANLDALTHLPNRRQFFMHVEQQLARAKRTADRFAVGIVDLDNFKPVNDVYGHHIGDLVLTEMGARLARIKIAGVQFYRLGGDEFAFEVVTDPQHTILRQIGKEVNRVIAQPIIADGIVISIKASIGACVFSNTKDTAQELYEHADFALYHVKRTGRGSMEIYSQTLEEERQHLNKVDQALRAADLEAELFPVFQPIVNVDSGAISSFESLARWNSPSIGIVPPGVFIGVAESLGIISDLTRLMFQKSIIAMGTWPAHIRLSFNLSAYDVTNKAVIEELIYMVAQSRIHPSRFVFEVTETALLQDFTTAKDNIELLRQSGARIALDDFGTGYSSLSHVQNLPLDKLKIDRSFIKDIETNSTSQTIVRSILALCQGMQVECVAEGAETESQVQFLQQMGCQLIQGYFYSKPMAEEHIQNYLAERSLTADLVVPEILKPGKVA